LSTTIVELSSVLLLSINSCRQVNYVLQYRVNMRWIGEFRFLYTRLVGAMPFQFSWCRLDYTTQNTRARIIRQVDSVVCVLASALCEVSNVSLMYNELTLFVTLFFLQVLGKQNLSFYNAFLLQEDIPLHFMYTV
jgi:hypothetical protein